MGCGSSASTAAPTTVPHLSAYTGSALSWLSTRARPWNKKLNDDQREVLVGSAATNKTDPTAFFTRLKSACTELAHAARGAGQVQKAPTESLAAAWKEMTDRTATYADDCVALTRTRSNADFTRWNASLQSLNTANATLNSAVASVRNASAESSG